MSFRAFRREERLVWFTRTTSAWSVLVVLILFAPSVWQVVVPHPQNVDLGRSEVVGEGALTDPLSMDTDRHVSQSVVFLFCFVPLSIVMLLSVRLHWGFYLGTTGCMLVLPTLLEALFALPLHLSLIQVLTGLYVLLGCPIGFRTAQLLVVPSSTLYCLSSVFLYDVSTSHKLLTAVVLGTIVLALLVVGWREALDERSFTETHDLHERAKSLQLQSSQMSRLLMEKTPGTRPGESTASRRPLRNLEIGYGTVVCVTLRGVHHWTGDAREDIPHSEVALRLRWLYETLDEAVQRHCCEKIKSLSSSYVAACGVPFKSSLGSAQQDAEAVVGFAIEALQFIRFVASEKHEHRTWGLEASITIATGHIVGGLIHRATYAYEMLGDAPRVAYYVSMYDQSVDCIRITAETKNLLSEEYVCNAYEPRYENDIESVEISLPRSMHTLVDDHPRSVWNTHWSANESGVESEWLAFQATASGGSVHNGREHKSRHEKKPPPKGVGLGEARGAEWRLPGADITPAVVVAPTPLPHSTIEYSLTNDRSQITWTSAGATADTGWMLWTRPFGNEGNETGSRFPAMTVTANALDKSRVTSPARRNGRARARNAAMRRVLLADADDDFQLDDYLLLGIADTDDDDDSTDALRMPMESENRPKPRPRERADPSIDAVAAIAEDEATVMGESESDSDLDDDGFGNFAIGNATRNEYLDPVHPYALTLYDAHKDIQFTEYHRVAVTRTGVPGLIWYVVWCFGAFAFPDLLHIFALLGPLLVSLVPLPVPNRLWYKVGGVVLWFIVFAVLPLVLQKEVAYAQVSDPDPFNVLGQMFLVQLSLHLSLLPWRSLTATFLSPMMLVFYAVYLASNVRPPGYTAFSALLSLLPSLATSITLLVLVQFRCEQRLVRCFLAQDRLALKLRDLQEEELDPHIKSKLALELAMVNSQSAKTYLVSVVHVNVVGIAKLLAFVELRGLFQFLSQILSIIRRLVNEAGACELRSFCGEYVAVFGLPLSDPSTTPSTSGNLFKYARNAIQLSMTIMDEIKLFSAKNQLHLAVSVGVTHGLVTAAVVGKTQLALDAWGEPLYLARQLALHSDGIKVLSPTINYLDGAALPGLDSLGHKEQGSIKLLNGQSALSFQLYDTQQAQTHRVNELRVTDYDVLSLLGTGGYGDVFLCREQRSGLLRAIKLLDKSRNGGVPNAMKEELNILTQVKHPNVVAFHHCIQTPERIFLVMEYIKGGTLRDVVRRTHLSARTLRFYVAELVLALECIHEMGIIHRDVKPENCMIGEDGHLKLVDFGLSEVVQGHGGHNLSRLFRALLPPTAAPPCASTSMLIAEPRNTSASALAKLGVQSVTAVTSMAEALEKLQEHVYDVLLLDDALLDVSVLGTLDALHPDLMVLLLCEAENAALSAAAQYGVEVPLPNTELKPITQGTLRTIESKLRTKSSKADGDWQHARTPVGQTKEVEAPVVHQQSMLPNKTANIVGTPVYIAPEVISNLRYSPAVDWWALGVLLFELIAGQVPFQGLSHLAIFEAIVAGVVPWEALATHDAARSLIEKLLTPQPSRRLGNGGAAEVKAHEYFSSIDWDTLGQADVPPEVENMQWENARDAPSAPPKATLERDFYGEFYDQWMLEGPGPLSPGDIANSRIGSRVVSRVASNAGSRASSFREPPSQPQSNRPSASMLSPLESLGGGSNKFDVVPGLSGGTVDGQGWGLDEGEGVYETKSDDDALDNEDLWRQMEKQVHQGHS